MAEVDFQTEILIDRPREHVAAYASSPDNVPHRYVNIRSVAWKTPLPTVVGSRIGFSRLMAPFLPGMIRRGSRRFCQRF